MKSVFTLIILMFVFNVQAQEFLFEKETIDYGKVAQNSNGQRTFVFKNVGKSPLIITNVKSSCGCTIPKIPEKPIMPGEKGEIVVSYNTKIIGGFHKTITVFSNAKNKQKRLKIKGYVSKEIVPKKEKNILSNY